jgi:hypothetical protein
MKKGQEVVMYLTNKTLISILFGVIISLVSLRCFSLTLDGCVDSVRLIKSTTKFPIRLDEVTEMIDISCSAELYKGKPIYEYTYLLGVTKDKLNIDVSKVMKVQLFNLNCVEQFEPASEYANKKYIYIDSLQNVVGEVFISSEECIAAAKSAKRIDENLKVISNQKNEDLSKAIILRQLNKALDNSELAPH